MSSASLDVGFRSSLTKSSGHQKVHEGILTNVELLGGRHNLGVVVSAIRYFKTIILLCSLFAQLKILINTPAAPANGAK